MADGYSLRREVEELAAQLMAVETLLRCFMAGAALYQRVDRDVLTAVFEDAKNIMKTNAENMCSRIADKQTTRALLVVEQHRKNLGLTKVN